jgi:hypothetical protein
VILKKKKDFLRR